MSFSIDWTDEYPWWKKPAAYFRLAKARRGYGVRLGIGLSSWKSQFIEKKRGYQEMTYRLMNVHEGVRCFILGDGSSLDDMDLSFLRDEITIGSNDSYGLCERIGRYLSYYTCTDAAFMQANRREVGKMRGPFKVFGLGISYCAPTDARTLFVDESPTAERRPMFSGDIAASAFVGVSPVYLNLQLAFHLGCNPVYLLGSAYGTNHDASGKRSSRNEDRFREEIGRAQKYYANHGRELFDVGGYDALGSIPGKSIDEMLPGGGVRKTEQQMSFGIRAENLDEVMKMIMPKRERSDRYYEKALELCKAGKPESAISMLDRALESGPNVHASYMRASLMKSLGRKSEASAAFHSLLEDRRLSLDRDVFGGAHFHLGEMSFQLGEYVIARHHFIKCLEAVPSHRKADEYMRVIRSEGPQVQSTEEAEALVP